MREGWEMNQAGREALELDASPVKTTEERETSGKFLVSGYQVQMSRREKMGAKGRDANILML